MSDRWQAWASRSTHSSAEVARARGRCEAIHVYAIEDLVDVTAAIVGRELGAIALALTEPVVLAVLQLA